MSRPPCGGAARAPPRAEASPPPDTSPELTWVAPADRGEDETPLGRSSDGAPSFGIRAEPAPGDSLVLDSRALVDQARDEDVSGGASEAGVPSDDLPLALSVGLLRAAHTPRLLAAEER